MGAQPHIHSVAAPDLTTRQLHDLLKLRADVFVVEQECAYPELDGRDLDTDTVHLWVEVEGRVAAIVRVLADGDGHRIGRVVTALEFRGEGHAATLMERAIADCPAWIELDAQSYLTDWYNRFGFVAAGEEFIEDGIPHVPMRRERDRSQAGR